MCGIAGAFHWEAPVDPGRVEAMVATLDHRGPDDRHLVAVGRGVMATARLAIVDLDGGRQPRWEPGERVCVSMNGEIYNHGPLRHEAESRDEPVVFASVSDTEVAGFLAGDNPQKALQQLNGQFALALWHAEREELWLARDRMGQKPLYWTRLDDGTLVYGSELKAVLAWPGVRREIDPVALQQLLLFEFVPAPRTIYAGIHKLVPGTRLEITATSERVVRWWEPPLIGADRAVGTQSRYAQAVLNTLQVATKRRLLADVPLAFLLSGGIDSSAVAAMATRFHEGPLTTFSVVFDEPSFDESGPARLMADHLGARHTELRFGHDQLPRLLARLEAGLCEPLADGSLLGTLLLAEGVHAAGYKVALSGDGADESFGGYPTYVAHRLAQVAEGASGLVGRLARRMPVSTDNLSSGYLARRFAAGLPHPHARRNQIWLGAFLPGELDGLVGGLDERVWTEVDGWAERAASIRDPAERAMYLDQRLYLGEGVLQKVDRAGMLCSLEVRSPFLDHHLVETAAALPASSFVRGNRTKVLLRRAVADLLPAALRTRKKKGFGTPLGPWLQGPQSGLLEGLVERLDGLIAPGPVERLVREHRDGVADHRRRLWTLIVLGTWRHGPWGPAGG